MNKNYYETYDREPRKSTQQPANTTPSVTEPNQTASQQPDQKNEEKKPKSFSFSARDKVSLFNVEECLSQVPFKSILSR